MFWVLTKKTGLQKCSPVFMALYVPAFCEFPTCAPPSAVLALLCTARLPLPRPGCPCGGPAFRGGLPPGRARWAPPALPPLRPLTCHLVLSHTLQCGPAFPLLLSREALLHFLSSPAPSPFLPVLPPKNRSLSGPEWRLPSPFPHPDLSATAMNSVTLEHLYIPAHLLSFTRLEVY